MNSEEEIMSEIENQNEECVFESSSCESFTSLICAGNANMVLEEPTSSEKSWTDEKHSLYLNFMEEAFISRFYEHGYCTYPSKRLQADRGEADSVFSNDLDEEVESGFSNDCEFPEESQSESEMPRMIYPDVQKHSKKWRMKDKCCSNETFQEQDTNRKRKKRKSEHEVAEPGRELNHVLDEVPDKNNHEHERNFYTVQDGITQNRNVSETSMKTSQEEQVVPSIVDISFMKDGKP